MTKRPAASDAPASDAPAGASSSTGMGPGPVTRSRSAKSGQPLFLPPEVALMHYRERMRKGLVEKSCPRNGDHSGVVLPKGHYEWFEDGTGVYYATPEEACPSQKPDCWSDEKFAKFKEIYARVRDYPEFDDPDTLPIPLHPATCECTIVECVYEVAMNCVRYLDGEEPI